VALDWRTATLRLPEGTDLVGTPPNPRTVQVIEAGGSYELLLAEHARQGQPQ
jgi:3-isopropylmalate/(R)-2-methylmalate dehydratase small subunit